LSGTLRQALNISDRGFEEVLIVEDDAFQGWFFGVPAGELDLVL
jgi:hypothetical protein